ncbi:MAG: ATP-binding cassette domain-containing protein [Bacteroidota bacterium]
MLTLKNVSLLRDGITVFDDISLEIRDGEFVFLVSQTGAGKSTLLRLISMDIRPTSGTVVAGGYDSTTIRARQIPFLRRQIGLIFQDSRLLEDRNVFENVAFPLYVTGAKNSQIKERVFKALDEVDLANKSTDMPNELSDGDQQRVAIARALVHDPFIILADEPSGNLDLGTAYGLLGLLRRINSRGTTVLTATHNYELVKKMPARLIQIRKGKLLEVELNV